MLLDMDMLLGFPNSKHFDIQKDLFGNASDALCDVVSLSSANNATIFDPKPFWNRRLHTTLDHLQLRWVFVYQVCLDIDHILWISCGVFLVAVFVFGSRLVPSELRRRWV